MKNVSDVWAKRFESYIVETQKYLRFIFTGHIALVVVFVIGALGYQYSEWLKVVEKDFPVDWVVATIIGIVVSLSAPATLLKAPDQVYLLPIEKSMRSYFKKALNWTFASQVIISVVLYIISIPLINTVTNLNSTQIWFGLLITIIMKYFHVQAEFHYRFANRGRLVWVDRVARCIMSILILQSVLGGALWIGSIMLLFLVMYSSALSRRSYEMPIPYEHFIQLEESRMMRFYRFANYFTDVPHLRGSVKRRGYLNFVYSFIRFQKDNTQLYLITRTFIRVSDHYFLFTRLTAISVIVALFAGIPIVVWIVTGALSFAMTLQLKQALASSHEFRMDMLYPIRKTQRNDAITKLLRILYVLQAIIVGVCSIGQPLFFVIPIAIMIAGELTLRFTK